jgi:carbon-monoxide dehydrogenase large subunit
VGSVAAFTGADICARARPLRIAPPIDGLLPTEMESLPVGKVRFVGDPVATVLAEDRATAEDAAAAVQVDYQPLPATVEPGVAGAADQPRVDDLLPSNVVYQGGFSTDPDAFATAWAAADAVVEASFQQHRQTHVPLEPRGCLAEWDAGDEALTLWCGSQVPHPLRSTLATRLGLAEGRVRVISPDVGGGFGRKIPLYREELSVCVAARLLNRPVKWIETRQENLLATLHAREDRVTARAAIRSDGRLLAVEAHLLADVGAYCWFPADYMARVVGMMIPGPYRLEHYRYDITSVLTNKCPAGPFRAPMLICTWVTEGLIDRIARELALDPVEVRRRNLVEREDQPYVSATGQRYEAITPRETLDRALTVLDYDQFRRDQSAARSAGRLLGLGICTYVEPTVYGSAFYRAAGIPGSGHDAATVRVEPSGQVVAQIGVASQGQGHRTTVAQVLADELGVRPGDVRVLSGDTSAAPYGMGTRGSRGGVVSAGSAMGAAAVLRAKLLAVAAAELESAPEDLELAEGRIQVKGAPQRGVALAAVARRAYLDPLSLPAGVSPGLEAHFAYDPPPLTFANATHVCVVEIDPGIGAAHIPRYLVVEDCGTRLNPLVVEGQVHGGAALGLSGVLREQVVYDADGQNLSATLLDYALPRAADLPWFEVLDIETPNPHTPRGAKGMAEGGTMGAAAAVCNAVADALAPLGISIVQQPLTAPVLHRLLCEAARARGATAAGS